MTVAAADCELLQRVVPQLQLAGGAGTCQSCSPVAIFNAVRPGLRAAPPGSATGMYTLSASAAKPHSMPPSAPPFPTFTCHKTFPLASGSNAHITPDS